MSPNPVSNEPDRTRPAGADFPYYDGNPVSLGPGQWTFVLFGVALGFAALLLPVPFFGTAVGQFVPALLFSLIPLAALAAASSGHWRALFRRVGFRDVLWMVGFGLLTMIASMAVGWLVASTLGANANPGFETMAAQSSGERVVSFAHIAVQLLGEEILTILPFLALLTWLTKGLGMSRGAAVFSSWIATALFFGAVHLPTYGWNFVQCFLIIGTARLVLTLAYLKTKNLWVSTGAHIVNDWTEFGLVLLLASLGGS